jgi:hypothetical protein
MKIALHVGMDENGAMNAHYDIDGEMTASEKELCFNRLAGGLVPFY